jgi:hypothetical protein
MSFGGSWESIPVSAQPMCADGCPVIALERPGQHATIGP